MSSNTPLEIISLWNLLSSFYENYSEDISIGAQWEGSFLRTTPRFEKFFLINILYERTLVSACKNDAKVLKNLLEKIRVLYPASSLLSHIGGGGAYSILNSKNYLHFWARGYNHSRKKYFLPSDLIYLREHLEHNTLTSLHADPNASAHEQLKTLALAYNGPDGFSKRLKNARCVALLGNDTHVAFYRKIEWRPSLILSYP